MQDRFDPDRISLHSVDITAAMSFPGWEHNIPVILVAMSMGQVLDEVRPILRRDYSRILSRPALAFSVAGGSGSP